MHFYTKPVKNQKIAHFLMKNKFDISGTLSDLISARKTEG